MPENIYTYLKFVRFKDIERWDMKSLLGNSLHFKYQECKFKKILSKTEIEWVDIEDELEYPILGVHAQGEGVYINNVSKGKSLTMKRYQKSKEMSLFYCKVRTVKGQWGIVYPEYSNSYGSSNMQYLDVAYDMIMPQYLMILLKSNRLTSHWDTNAIGADGRHFNFDTLMNLTFPLPSLAEQDALVSAYNNKISQSEAFEKQAAQVEQGIEDYLLSELGIKQKGYTQAEPAATIASEPQVEYVVSNRQLEDRSDTYHWGDEIKKEYKYLKFVRFRDVERWDVYSENIKFNAKYNIILLGDLIKRIATGTTPPTSQKDYFNGSIKFFTPSDFSGEMYLDKSDRFISQQAIDDNKARLFTSGDILFVGIGSTVGKVGVVKDTVVSSNQQITGFTLETKKISPEYAFCFMNYNKGITTKEQAKTTLPIVNQSKIIKIPIPLPPIDIQNAIVEHINKQKEQIKQLRQQAESLRKEALEEFEKEIFE